MRRSKPAAAPEPDRTARLLELGLCAVILVAPLPFGSVGATGRLIVELSALGLLLVWLVRALLFPTKLPPRPILLGLLGLLGLAALQALPLGSTAVSALSPRAVEIRVESRTPPEAEPAERQMLGREIAGLDPAPALSLDPGSTASALRTGSALVALLVVATTVASTCGLRRLALALLFSAGFQGLYGLLVLASGHDRIWHLPKKYFLDSATGTFVNRNHFACLLAMSLACGMGLIYHNARARRHAARGAGRLVDLFTSENIRNLLLGLLLIIGLAGLLLSFSRAGIAAGLLALAATILAAGRFQVVRTRILIALLLLSVAVVPLSRLGSERLIERFANSTADLVSRRTTVWSDSLALVADFPVTGSGFGTFASAYPLVRSPEIRSFFAHAHNDPLQLLVEGGLLAGVLLVILLIPLLRRMAHALRGRAGAIAVGFAAGLMAMLLHALVDFNFHIPANAATASIIAGGLLGVPWSRES